MPRFFLKLSFKGTAYAGWQIQDNAVTVQEKLNDALSVLLGHPTETTGCGRTDTGVHAKQFYAHFDTLNELADSRKLVYSLNAILPADIAIHDVIPVANEQHARFDATRRTYEYYLTSTKNPFLKEYVMFNHMPIDLPLMNEASNYLLKQEDFSSFSKSNTQVKTNICHIYRADWQQKNGMYIFTISADRFLRGMVRAIVGTLLEVGTTRLSPGKIPKIIALKDRSEAGTTVPACGLYLSKIEYPFIPPAEPSTFPA